MTNDIKKLLDEASEVAKKIKRQKHLDNKWRIKNESVYPHELKEFYALNDELGPIDTKQIILDLCDKYKEIIVELHVALTDLLDYGYLHAGPRAKEALAKVEARLRGMK